MSQEPQSYHQIFLMSVWAAYMRGEAIPALQIPLKDGPSGRRPEVSSLGRKLIEIEALGWKLEHYAVAPDDHGNTIAYPVFRAVPGATVVQPGT